MSLRRTGSQETAQTAHPIYRAHAGARKAPRPRASGDAARSCAGPGLVVPDQLPYPAGRREPAHLVRLDEQRGEVASHLLRLLGGEVSRHFVQQADELADVGRPGDPSLAREAGQVSLRRVAKEISMSPNGVRDFL